MYPTPGQSSLKEMIISPCRDWNPRIPRGSSGINFWFTKARGYKAVTGWQPWDAGASARNPFLVYSAMSLAYSGNYGGGVFPGIPVTGGGYYAIGGTQTCQNIQGPQGYIYTATGTPLVAPGYAWIGEASLSGLLPSTGWVISGSGAVETWSGGDIFNAPITLTLSGLVNPSLSLAQTAANMVAMSPATGQMQWWDVYTSEAGNLYPTGAGTLGMLAGGTMDASFANNQTYFSIAPGAPLPWWSGLPVMPGAPSSGGPEFGYYLIPAPGSTASVTSVDRIYAGWYNDAVQAGGNGPGAGYPANIVSARMVWQPSQPCFAWYGEVLFDASGNPIQWIRFRLLGNAKPTQWYTIPAPLLAPSGPGSGYWNYTADIVYLFVNCLPRDFVAANPGWGASQL